MIAEYFKIGSRNQIDMMHYCTFLPANIFNLYSSL